MRYGPCVEAGQRGGEAASVVSIALRREVMFVYFAPLISLLGVCGVPAMIAAGIVFLGWVVYVFAFRSRK